MRKVNWDTVEERSGDFRNPEPGAYVAQIVNVEDREDKEYLLLEWEFASGEWKGENGRTFQRANFWPMPYYASYKESALGFFKHFKKAVEESNRGYLFDEENVQGLRGKFFGVILGEEEYLKKDGSLGTRLKATNCCNIQDVQSGNFTVPKKRPLKTDAKPAAVLQELTEDDGELPF